MLVFSAVVVSLTLVALAAPDAKTFDLKFKGEGDFCADELGRFIPCRELGDLLNISHLRLSEVEWKLLYVPPEEPPFGWFTITAANGDILEGIYDGFAITPTSPTTGTYDLDWLFTGDTGRFESATGTGHTDGLVDFETFEAEFEFSDTITVPKGK